MSHFAEPFATRVNEILHDVFGGTRFYKKGAVLGGAGTSRLYKSSHLTNYSVL